MIKPKKTLLLLLLMGALYWEAFSQEERIIRTMQVTATATVVDNLQLVTLRDLDLINPPVTGNEILVLPQESAFAGLFRVQGTPASTVRVTYLRLETLQEAGGNGGEIDVRYLISGNTVDNQQQSLLYAPTGEIDIQLGRDGLFFIWLGAELDISRAKAGEYFSEFIIELEYM